MLSIPDGFTRTLQELHGAEGVAWLERLPSLLAGLAGRWSLRLHPPLEPLSYNYVCPVVREDGSHAVLKVGFPHPELLSEIEALRKFAGHGVIQLFEASPADAAMLLERLLPGAPLSSIEDDGQATSIAASVMRQLWIPTPAEHNFPAVGKWVLGLQRLRQEFGGGSGPFPERLVRAAETLFSELIASIDSEMLLHGDLHHDNVLSAKRAPWLALDPKGLIGEPEYEVGALLRNPKPWLLDQPHPGSILNRRLDQLSEELGFDRQRLHGWAFSQAVLTAWWSYEDHGYGWETDIAIARILLDMQ